MYVKFTSQNDDFSYSNFSDTYLNRFNWTDRLKKANILPVLNTNKFVSIKSKNCIIVPEVISYIYKNTNNKNVFRYNLLIGLVPKKYRKKYILIYTIFIYFNINRLKYFIKIYFHFINIFVSLVDIPISSF